MYSVPCNQKQNKPKHYSKVALKNRKYDNTILKDVNQAK